MRINSQYLSIPPYISTSWNHVKSLQMSGNQLVVKLKDDSLIHVPDLDLEDLEQVFEAHAAYLEEGNSPVINKLKEGNKPIPQNPFASLQGGLMSEGGVTPFKIGLGGLDGLGTALQHNMEYADSPDLPPEVLEKVGHVAKLFAPEQGVEVPQPEPHCNCPHCQISRAINKGLGNHEHPYPDQKEAVLEDEVVEDEELVFQQWVIEQTGEQMYTVTNKLDADEKYNVFLGEPVGCTCGNKGCEHIVAVLQS